MASPIKSLYLVGLFGVGGLVGALGVIRLTRMAESFWFRPAQRRAITNGQRGRATATPATGSDFSPGEALTIKKIEQLKASLDEIGQILQGKNALELEVAHLKRLIEEKKRALSEANTSKGTYSSVNLERNGAESEGVDARRTDALQSESNENGDDVAKKAIESHQAIDREAMSTDPRRMEGVHLNNDRGDSSKESTETRDRKPGNSHRTTRDSHASTKGEQLHKPAALPLGGNSDIISVADVAESVRILNGRILQASSLIADLLSYRESAISSKELADTLNGLTGYIGPRLCNNLQSKSKESSTGPGPLITQIALQAGLVKACSHIVNNGTPPSDGATRTHSDMLVVYQATADAQKAHTCTPTSQSVNWRYVAGIAAKLIAAVGGSLDSGGALPPQYHDVVDELVKASLELHKEVDEEAALIMELVTYTTPCDTDFDPSQMDPEGDGKATRHIMQDSILCTLEMGLQCRKKESGSGGEWRVAMKTKVALTSTLEV